MFEEEGESVLKEIISTYKRGDMRELRQRIFRYFPSHVRIKRNEKRKLQYGLNKEKRHERIVVSLTSFPPRLENLNQSLKSLLFQTYKPDRIVVWFGSDVKRNMLPGNLIDLKKYGIEYRFDSDMNIMPHKKYWYIMQEEPDSIIITVDDDAVYDDNLIKSLMKTHKKYPDCVCARRVHRITRTDDGHIADYKKWVHECKRIKIPSYDLIAVGVGGVLYPSSRCLDDRVFDVETFDETCPKTDDIWLKCMETLNGTKVVWTPCMFPHPASLKGIASLNDSNVDAGINNKCLMTLINKYDDLKEEAFI